MKPLYYAPQAVKDIDQCAAWIRKKNPEAAHRFLASVERTCAILSEMPGIGSPRYADIPLVHGVRMIKMGKGFENYLLFYIEHETQIDVIRVLHSARNISEALQRARVRENELKCISKGMCFVSITRELSDTDQENHGTS